MTVIEQLPDEARHLLCRILESMSYRQRAAANIRGHALKLIPDLLGKQALVAELDAHLGALAEIETLHALAGGQDPYDRIRERMERIPYPTTRMDLSACLSLTERAEQALSQAYVDSRIAPLAGVARLALETERPFTAGELDRFLAFAQEPENRPRAQECFDRWFLICLTALGRPGTAGDQRAVDLELRGKLVADVILEFIESVDELRLRAGLAWTDVPTTVDLPAAAKARLEVAG